uniref:Putative UbiA prenyltransferase family protein n=1 Tax=viral metagenome TaxID=1070528 RepID=A0A6M3M5H0_9ZZZZ
MKAKLKAHLFTLPRWFAAPFFGCSLLMGAVLAGDLCANAWIALAGGLLIMAGGHSWNSFLDYAWTGLDKGEVEDRSAEKDYTGGQNLIENGILSLREVAANAIGWYILALIPIIYLSVKVSWVLLPLAIAGMLVTFWYSWGKFNWTHETALAVGVGPIAVLIGMFSVNPDPPWLIGLLVSIPVAVILCYLGLAFDEWPDAEANLKKGVKSLAYKVWEYGLSLEWYVMSWFLFVFIYQVFLIAVGILAPMTAISFFTFPGMIATLVLLKADFRKAGGFLVLVAAMYPVLLLAGQILGG